MNDNYHKEGILCSFPYEFTLKKDGDQIMGYETSYIYCNLQINDEQRKKIEEQLANIHTSKGAKFYLEGTDINYHIEAPGLARDTDSENEVNIRRNFIENYLEAEDELDAMVLSYHGSSRKTEFKKF